MHIWYILLIAIPVCLALFYFRNDQHKTRLAYLERKRQRRIERKLDLLLKHFSIEDPGESADDDIVELALSGQKIEALKIYRILHPHEGLKDAKRAIDNIIRQPQK
ncbi:MAG TPA: hypothetical protein DD379_23790 [Cyanobacteria bacterium UBA11162]|nr:hypothetical protein [Cyanobacteria bacterium UBA11162]